MSKFKALSPNRRELMISALKAGAAVSMSGAFAHGAKADQPRNGGVLRLGMGHGSTTDSLDPAVTTNGFTVALSHATRNGLNVIAADGSLQPDLAESYESTPDAKVWTFHLRKGVTFHNGKSLTPQDVIESINHHRGEKSKSPVKSLLAVIDTAEADGPSKVVLSLKEGTADIPFYFADKSLPICPAREGGGIDFAGMGTGPMVLESFEPGVRAKLRKNPNYHFQGRPYFDGAELYTIPDASARINALLSGGIDYADRIEPKILGRVLSDGKVELLVVKGTSHFTAPMNGTIAPFNDRNVQLAVKYAIDRQEIVTKILGGYGSPGNDNPVADSMKYSIDPDPKHVFDLDKAKFHLKQAGLSSLDLTLSTADAAFTGAVDTGLLMKDSAAKAGINIDIDHVSSDGYFTNTWMKKPWSMSYWNGRATCDILFSQLYTSTAPWNEAAYKSERFDALAKQGRAELDDAKRAAIYAEMQQLIHDESGQLVLMFNHYLGLHSKRLRHGDKIGSNIDLDGARIFERWWFAD